MSSSGEILKKIDPIHYFEQFLPEGIYPDGRNTCQFRPLSVEMGVDKQSHGSAFVQQDGTNVICTAQLSIAPYSDEPIVELEIDALENVPKGPLEHSKSLLGHLLEKNVLIPPDSLRITVTSKGQQGNLVSSMTYDLRWTILLRITIISTNGFMFGAILTAVQTALMNITLPRMEYVGEGLLADEFESGEEIQLQFVIDKLKVVDQPSHEQTQLKLKELLVYTPFLLYTSTKNSDEEYSILIDPASDLIDLISDYAECIVGENKNFHLLNISSSRGLEPSLVQEISTIALKRYRTVLNTLKKLHL